MFVLQMHPLAQPAVRRRSKPDASRMVVVAAQSSAPSKSIAAKDIPFDHPSFALDRVSLTELVRLFIARAEDIALLFSVRVNVPDYLHAFAAFHLYICDRFGLLVPAIPVKL